MFKHEDREALQILIDNGTITEENMKTPHVTLDATSTTISFWAVISYIDGLLSHHPILYMITISFTAFIDVYSVLEIVSPV